VVHRADGGRTSLTNLKDYCWWHHHVVLHQLGWTLQAHPDGTSQVTSPAGKVIRSHPAPGDQPVSGRALARPDGRGPGFHAAVDWTIGRGHGPGRRVGQTRYRTFSWPSCCLGNVGLERRRQAVRLMASLIANREGSYRRLRVRDRRMGHMSNAHRDRVRRAMAERERGRARVRSTTTTVTMASVAAAGIVALTLPGSTHKAASSSSGSSSSGTSANSGSGSSSSSGSTSSGSSSSGSSSSGSSSTGSSSNSNSGSSGFSSGSAPSSSSGGSQVTSGGS
jgi:hypothetical protein